MKMLMAAFDNPTHADLALDELEACGYTPEQISVISKDNKYQREGYSTGENVAKAAGTGAVTGGALGGLAGLLAGAGIIPALAGLFIGGPIAAALGLAGIAATTASGAVTGAAAGGLLGALTGLGLPKETATNYRDAVDAGGVLIGLSGHDDITDESRAILEKHGARDINLIDVHEQESATTTADEVETEADTTRHTGAMRQQPSFGERRDTEM